MTPLHLKLLGLFGILGSFELLEARIWRRCDFLTELRKQNVTEDLLATWLCLAEEESHRNSSLKQSVVDGSATLTDEGCDKENRFGIFQIPSVWCMDEEIPLEDCQIHGCTDNSCDEYLDEDLSNDIQCAIKIHAIYDFERWPASTQEKCGNSPTTIDVEAICAEENYESPVATALIISTTVLILVSLITALIWRQWAKSFLLTTEEYKKFKYGIKSDDEEGYDVDDVTARPYDPEYEIPATDYELDTKEILGQGAYGYVFKGVVRKQPVAVKTVKPYSDKNFLLALLDEIKIMIYLGKHDHILELVGAATKHLRKGLVYAFVEYCELGSLEKCLKSKQDGEKFSNHMQNDKFVFQPTSNRTSNLEVESPISTIDLILWSYQICKGMEYLGEKKVVHGDLATRNVLLSHRSCVKICDFGLARKMYGYTRSKNNKKKRSESQAEAEQMPMPWRWMSIESLKDLKFSTESDIWSFGVTLWEIFSLGDLPYPGIDWMPNWVDQLTSGLRMKKPRFSTTDLYNATMVYCWQERPEMRKSFMEMAVYFNTILTSISSQGYDTIGHVPEAKETLEGLNSNVHVKKRNQQIRDDDDTRL